jgi:CrcB protein
MGFASFLAVGIGGLFGSLLRWGVGVTLNPVFSTLPLGTLAVNLIGGFAIGVALAFFDHYHQLPPEWRLFVITGLCGGFTTFSAFSGETAILLLRQQYAWTFAIVAAHVLGSLAMTLAGIFLMRVLLRA